MNQSWTLCWTFTAKSYRKAPRHSPSPPCPCSSWTTTSTTTRTTRPPSWAGISPLLREVTQLEVEETTGGYAVVFVPTREACASSWHLLMMMVPRTQHLHPTPRPQPRSLHHPCCLPIAHTQRWSPLMVPPKEHTSLTCRPHLPQQGVSRSGCPPWYIPPTTAVPLTPSQMI